MRVLRGKAFVTLVFVVCSWNARDARAWGQDQPAAPRLPQEITAEDAKALEEGLKANPDNRAAREKLITYYFRAMLMSRAPGLEERREQHIFWLIEHHPDSELAGSPEAGIQPVGL